jgi:AraC-like DNA-binding protein
MEYRIDLFAIFIFLGIIQGVFLCFFFFSRENRRTQYNVFQGLLLLSTALCLLEIFLQYTGHIIQLLPLVNFSEPVALFIGPSLFMIVLSFINGKVSKKQVWVHSAFPIFYTLTMLPFVFSSSDVKYNSWIGDYHPGLPFREVADYPQRFLLNDWHTELVLISLAIYTTLSTIEIVRVFRLKKQSFYNPESFQLRIIRNKVILMAMLLVLLVVVKFLNEDDTGDHLVAAFGAFIIYSVSFSVIANSGFFKQASLNDQQKYKSSTITLEQLQVYLSRLKEVMATQKPFLQPSFSLSDLAQLMNLSSHSVSQIINDGLGKSFFEMIAEYRVEEAKKLLVDQSNIKIEEIAEQVGYNSKSSFNTAFKKITGKTPSEFRS